MGTISLAGIDFPVAVLWTRRLPNPINARPDHTRGVSTAAGCLQLITAGCGELSGESGLHYQDAVTDTLPSRVGVGIRMIDTPRASDF